MKVSVVPYFCTDDNVTVFIEMSENGAFELVEKPLQGLEATP